MKRNQGGGDNTHTSNSCSCKKEPPKRGGWTEGKGH